jgi:hypothetical protein
MEATEKAEYAEMSNQRPPSQLSAPMSGQPNPTMAAAPKPADGLGGPMDSAPQPPPPVSGDDFTIYFDFWWLGRGLNPGFSPLFCR